MTDLTYLTDSTHQTHLTYLTYPTDSTHLTYLATRLYNPPMTSPLGPAAGDVVIRGSFGAGFRVVDATTDRTLAGGELSLSDALVAALALTRGQVWQQHSDHRGRPISPPFRLSPLSI